MFIKEEKTIAINIVEKIWTEEIAPLGGIWIIEANEIAKNIVPQMLPEKGVKIVDELCDGYWGETNIVIWIEGYDYRTGLTMYEKPKGTLGYEEWSDFSEYINPYLNYRYSEINPSKYAKTIIKTLKEIKEKQEKELKNITEVTVICKENEELLIGQEIVMNCYGEYHKTSGYPEEAYEEKVKVKFNRISKKQNPVFEIMEDIEIELITPLEDKVFKMI